MKKVKKYVSISTYADMCKISKTAIYSRIELKEIKTEFDKTTSSQVIDINEYPPKPEKKRGRKTFIGDC